MITIFTTDGANPRVQIGTTEANIAEDKDNNVLHAVVNTSGCEAAAALLEAINNLTPQAANELETLLTIIYRAGLTAK
ncbi:MAG: hypothetical protein WCQ60_00870 [bacterium]